MHNAARLLERHFQTLVNDDERWKKLIADDIVWELPYAPGAGSSVKPRRTQCGRAPCRLVSLRPVENFRFHDLRILPGLDPNSAVAEVKAEGIIKPTGRVYRQEYVVFLRAAGGKVTLLYASTSTPCVPHTRSPNRCTTRGNEAMPVLGAFR